MVTPGGVRKQRSGNHGRRDSREVGSWRKHSRDRTRDRQRLTRARKRPLSMEGTSGRGLRTIFTEGRRKRPRRPGSKAGVKAPAGKTGATGVSEVRSDGERSEEETPKPNPSGSPKRIGRRETPGPPVSWSRGQARGHGRGASLEEMPVTHEASGARRRSNGKQKSVSSILHVVRSESQGKLQEDGLARSKPPHR